MSKKNKKQKNDAHKTNVMRILDQAHLDYESQFYEADDGALDGFPSRTKSAKIRTKSLRPWCAAVTPAASRSL